MNDHFTNLAQVIMRQVDLAVQSKDYLKFVRVTQADVEPIKKQIAKFPKYVVTDNAVGFNVATGSYFVSVEVV